jgi:hypothetical protein
MIPRYRHMEIRWCVRFKSITDPESYFESYDTAAEADRAASGCDVTERTVGLYVRAPDPDAESFPAGLLQHIGDWTDYEAARDMLDVLTGSTAEERAAAGDVNVYTAPDSALLNQLADDLEAGVAADIWYDADHFSDMDRDAEGLGEDEETPAQKRIAATQDAMQQSAALLRGKPVKAAPSFDEQQALAALCIWEAMLEGARWRGTQPGTCRLPHLEKLFNDYGSFTMRDHALRLAPLVEASFMTIPEDERELVTYDWEYVAEFVAMEFQVKGGGALSGKRLSPAEIGRLVMASIKPTIPSGGEHVATDGQVTA